MTFEDLVKANKTIKTTDIRGKQYAEVNQRVKAFRSIYPEGFIETDILSIEDGVVVMRATVGFYDADRDGERVILATGTAYEKENSTNINKTSYIENCETSAVGRALAMAGLGIDTSIASVEEVQNAVEQQEQQKVAEKKITDTMVAGLISEAKEYELTAEDICAAYKKESLADITMAEQAQIRRNWKKLVEWKGKRNAGEGNN